MKTVELKVPRVIDDAGNVIGYGGSQDWFPDGWKRMSGCGATAGAGAAAVLAANVPGAQALAGPLAEAIVGNPPEACGPVPKAAYVDLMLEMFSRMTPKMMGYPYAGKWGRAFRTYAREKGIAAETDVYDRWDRWQDAFAFVKTHIDAGVPVPMLVLYHRAPEMQDEIWHWILVTGYEEPGDEDAAARIIISDYADRDLYDAPVMLEVHPRNLVKMVDLKIAQE